MKTQPHHPLPQIAKLFNHATRPNKTVRIDGNFQELKANRSFCCFAQIEDGYCIMCGCMADNLL